MIGDDVKVKVVKNNHGQIHLGIDAPREVPVHREEVYDKIQAEQSEVNDDSQ
jgi:carbon storage regulator